MMTEEERVGLKQSEAFFNFGSDGEELGGRFGTSPKNQRLCFCAHSQDGGLDHDPPISPASSPHGCRISARPPHCANCWPPSHPWRTGLSRTLRSPPPSAAICLCISWSRTSGP